MPSEQAGETPTCVLTLNGGSSSIKFAVFAAKSPLRRLAAGQVERLRPGDHDRAIRELFLVIEPHLQNLRLLGVGHRIVHGGTKLLEHQTVSDALLEELRRNESLDLAHLPREIALIEAMQTRFPDVPQIACFDTAFFRELPRAARLLPIPQKYTDAGIRRLGFHGLSYTFLMDELRRTADEAADGRIVLAHLGSGASMAAVHHGKPVDTSMAFTPTAGLVMATRPGDLDPGLLVHLMRDGNLSPDEMDRLLSSECGLRGIAGSADMRDLLTRRQTDERAAAAVELFCYQARKLIGAYAAAMGGIETLVFAGGIGENSPVVREEICAGLEFLGVRLDRSRNRNADSVVSVDSAKVVVRVISTDEEIVIAQTVVQLTRNPKSP